MLHDIEEGGGEGDEGHQFYDLPPASLAPLAQANGEDDHRNRDDEQEQRGHSLESTSTKPMLVAPASPYDAFPPALLEKAAGLSISSASRLGHSQGIAPALWSFRLALGAKGRERRAGPHLHELANHFWLDRLERGNHGANIGLGSKGFQAPGGCARRSAMTHRAGA
jgi:hypothetical protein